VNITHVLPITTIAKCEVIFSWLPPVASILKMVGHPEGPLRRIEFKEVELFINKSERKA